MIAKLAIYAVLLTALAIVIISTGRIGHAVFSVSTGGNIALINNDVDHNYEDDTSNDEPPILPINQHKVSVERGEKERDVLQRVMKLPRRTIDPTKLPYKCGAIFVQHNVPGIDGEAIDDWIRDLSDYHHDSGVAYISSEDAGSREAFIAQINEQIEIEGQFHWTIFGSGEHGLALASDEDVLRKLRENMEERGCQLVSMAIFLEPLDYSMKQTRQFIDKCKSCDVSEFIQKLENVGVAHWRGQLDHFLYTTGELQVYLDNSKVREGITKLRENFDLVLYYGSDDFAKEILQVTGWKAPDGEDVVKAELDMEIEGFRYSKEMVKQYTKFDALNGDVKFFEAVNLIYRNRLKFLFNKTEEK